MRWVIGFALLLAGCSDGFQRAGPPERAVVLQRPAQQLQSQAFTDDPFVAVTEYRKQNGLSALRPDEQLNRLALEQAEAMATSGRFDHTSSAGTFMVRMSRANVSARVFENIAYGNASFSATLRQWVNSPQHRSNMLYGPATRMGVASARSDDGKTYWVLLVGSGG